MTDDTCVQPHYFAHVATFISQHTDLADVNFSQHAPSQQTDPPAAQAAAASEPVSAHSTAPGSPSASSSSAASDGGSSSFEFIEASTEELRQQQEEADGLVGAGSLGPKEEAREVLHEAKDELRRQKL